MAKLSYTCRKQTHSLQIMVFKGVKTVGNLIKDENNFLSFSDFIERYNIKTNFLTFHGVISALKTLWKKNEANLHNDNGSIYKTIIDTFLKKKKPNRLAYKILVSNPAP